MNSTFNYSFYTDTESYQLLVRKDKKNIGYFKRNIKMDLYLVDGNYKYLYKLDGSKYFKNYKLICSNIKIYIFVKDNKLYVKYSNSASGKIIEEMKLL